MKVLVACEFSGIVREAFAERGHNAWSCDLLPTEIFGQHIQGDFREYLREGWDLGIFHIPCSRIANSGVRWLIERNLWKELDESCALFLSALNAPIPRIAIENPVPHKYALERIGKKYNQIIQPYQFGHGETKKTCLWLINLPLLIPTKIVSGRLARVHREPPSAERWKNRSRTYQGIANAMAEQWG